MNIAVPKDLLLSIIKGPLEKALIIKGGFGSANILEQGKGVLDDTTKLVVYSKKNKRVAFVLSSFTKYGSLPTRNFTTSHSIKVKLGEKLGSVILDPIIYGESKGVEYVVWPYCEPLKTNRFLRKIQLIYLKPALLGWLLGMTVKSRKSLDKREVLESFIKPLKRLKGKNISERVKQEINWQLEKLEKKDWQPFFVIAHNDLWCDNFLISNQPVTKANGFRKLVIIDWAGANEKGFAMYDLVRLSMSLGVSRAEFTKQVRKHCKVLDCDLRNSLGYLLASFACLSENLEEFPEERFIALLHKSFDYLDARL